MQYRKWQDGKTITSILGFGCMRFKTEKGKVIEDKATALIDKAYKSGINYFDTAVPYLGGQSEPLVGKALKKYPRSSYYIATKFSSWDFISIEEVQDLIDKQLENLQTDYIDFYLLHALNKNRLQKMKEFDVLSLVKSWQEQGKIKKIGFSFHDDYPTFKEILNLYDWEFCQIQFNYMDKDIQQGMQGYYDLLDRNIPIIVMEPLKGGSLSRFNPRVMEMFRIKSEDSLTKWALRWVLSQKGIMTALSGMNEMEQLDENLKICDTFVPMTKNEEQLVERIAEELKKIEIVGCTKCEYCMPCPVGVNIPGNFSMINDYAMYENKGHTGWLKYLLENAKADASYCVDCKKCVPKCPQNINIPIELKKVKEFLDNLFESS